jgi:ssDNA-binding Zn-finger/Zn-ribbon topoisomerase 1
MAEPLPDNMLTERTCPDCGGRMLVKTARETGHQFLGCERWKPGNLGCLHTEGIPEGIYMRLAGHPTLPGME